jgi:ribosomal protein L37AE/L43A
MRNISTPGEKKLASILRWQSDSPKSITDIEASKELNIGDNELSEINNIRKNLVSTRKLTNFKCSKCDNDVKIPFGASSIHCSNCGSAFQEGEYPRYSFDINRGEAIKVIKERIAKDLNRIGIELHEQTMVPSLVGSMKHVEIGIEPMVSTARLKDYFSLRGSISSRKCSLSILIAPSFEELLIHYAKDMPESILLTIEELFDDDTDLSKLVVNKEGSILSTLRIAKSLGGDFEELEIADDIADRMGELLRTLVPLSIQSTDGNPSSIGNKFQRNICIVLSIFTPIQVRPVGGKNHEDAVIRHFYGLEKEIPRYYPVGIKTFKGDMKTAKFFPLKKAANQIRRYARAYLQKEVLDETSVPAYILIAHDFDMQNEDNLKEISAFESDVGIPLKLLPVKTIIGLVEEYTSLVVDRQPKEFIEEFLMSKEPYLDMNHVHALIEKIRKHEEQEKKDQRLVKVRRKLAEKHA